MRHLPSASLISSSLSLSALRPASLLSLISCLALSSACNLIDEPGEPGEPGETGDSSEPLAGERLSEVTTLAIPTTASRSLAISAASVLQPCLTNAGLTACGVGGESAFALRKTLGVMLSTAGQTSNQMTQAALARQLWDTQNTIAGAQTVAANPQCNETTNGSGQATINGFPIQCARNEGTMAAAGVDLFTPASLDYFYPIALVNRLDLRDPASTTCGEYRILYGRKDATTGPLALDGRALLIFEAAMPNPRPALGVAGCTPVANLWAGLSDPAVTAAAAQATLVTFFYTGTTFTYPDGVSVTAQPLMHYANLGASRGQIRMNNFLNGSGEARWQLRELRTQLSGGRLIVRPQYVNANPWPGLFSAATGSDAFSTWFLGQLPNLMINDINGFFLADNATFGAGQSDSQTIFTEGPLGDATQFSNDYVLFASLPLTLAVETQLLSMGSLLTPLDIFNRATAMSCGGCHQHSNNDLLGGGLVWPASATFVHVNETPGSATAAPDAFGAASRSFQLSPAMINTFLPFRMTNLRCLAFGECPTSIQQQKLLPQGGRRSS